METQHTDAPTQTRRATVGVNFGGEIRRFEYRPSLTVGKLREEAIQVFGIVTTPHLFGLFAETGGELQDAATLHDAGVRPKDTLILRQSTVRAG